MTAIGSLCSGIGGLELGLERQIPGSRTVWQVEIDPFCRRVLARHWPYAKRYEDITAVDGAALAPVDVICAGFPCQDISYAGRGAGLDGERSRIFWDVVRIVADVRPKIVVLENVPALISRGLGVVVDALDQLGFVGEWDLVSAASVGAPHLRRRLFVVAAHPDRLELRDWPKRGPWRRPRDLRRERLSLAADHGGQEPVADADVQPLDVAEQGRPRLAEPAWARDDGDLGGGRTWPAPPATRGMDSGLFPGLDRPRRRGLRDEARLRALGNAVVSQAAEVPGLRCAELLGLA